jgi:AGZA family xanthine/uracil permease-like MFS transporter
MTRGLAEVEWRDMTEAAPAVIAALSMPFTYSIATGIAFGFISYAVIKLLAGQARQVKATVWVIALLWLLKLALLDSAH